MTRIFLDDPIVPSPPQGLTHAPAANFHRAGLRLVLSVLFLIVLPGSLQAQQFVARVDRMRIADNETLTLEVVYSERADTSAIDFEAMLPDFSILNNRPSSQTQIINLKRSSQTRWKLTLMPRRTGRLRIPAFRIGSARTHPIDIIVAAAPQSPEEGSPFSARIDADREQAFVGEQILIRIRLSASPEISDLRGSALEVPDADTTLVGQSEFQRIVDGEPYQVTELVYALFPKAPGRVSIPSLQYTGSSRRRRLVVARTQPLTIEIRDPAADPEASQHRPWLPANAIALVSEWSGSTDSLAVGQPITRTIRITAAGQHATAIPPLTLPDGAFKQYSEQPSLEDVERSAGILGRRSESVVLIPTAKGELQLPAIEIHWWNIDEHRWQIARLPARTLQVAAAAPDARIRPEVDVDSSNVSDADQPVALSRYTDPWIVGLGLLSAFLLALCLGLWRRIRRLESNAGKSGPVADAFARATNERNAFQKAMRSLSREDPGESRRDILAWARIRSPEDGLMRLDQLGGVFQDERLPQALTRLDAQLYRNARNSTDVDYPQLRKLLAAERERTQSVRGDDDSALPALYPEAS